MIHSTKFIGLFRSFWVVVLAFLLMQHVVLLRILQVTSETRNLNLLVLQISENTQDSNSGDLNQFLVQNHLPPFHNYRSYRGRRR